MSTPQYHQLTWEQFVEQYKPIKNKFTKDPDQVMFETYGEEVEFVKQQDPYHIWTYVDGDTASLTINGWAFVNRIGYYVTEVPWKEEDYYEIDIQPWPESCEACGEAETLDGELIMEVFRCDAQNEYCLNCCGCEDHVGEAWY